MIWEYYTRAAEIKGRRSSNGEDVQANYSLLKFFENIHQEELNALTKAFLGDQPERERLFAGRDGAEEIAGLEDHYVESPNESQRRAIAMALREPISFIKGPPGTGKTSTILNLASCIVGRGKTLAVVSSNNEALDNIKDKLEKLDQEGNPLCQRLLGRCKRLGDRRIRQALYREMKRHSELGNVFHTVTEEAENGSERDVDWQMDAEAFQSIYPMVISTIHSLKPFFTDYACSFDYVIMDESSQTGAVEGVLAMSCAEHLVLVGDEDQLPPVLGMEVGAKIEEMRQQLGGEVPEVYRVTADKSFLDICLEVFAPEIEAYGIRQMLREHYRCHPGIIEFCKREIYDGELEIRTENYDRDINVPIKILWFEGDYCEAFRDDGGKIYGSKTNRAQIAIFMEEELPGLVDRMMVQEETGDDGMEICILTPFRGLLFELQEEIREFLNSTGNGGNLFTSLRTHREAMGREEDGFDESNGDDAVCLTISRKLRDGANTVNRAQGREYDIVYLLPVEDGGGEHPWSQQRKLVNVAVSRAKKELRVITSVRLMSRRIQEKLVGYSITPIGRENDLYIQKLVDYVYAEVGESEPQNEKQRQFGFHRAKRRSVFDIWPKFVEENDAAKSVITEDCVVNALEASALFREEKLRIHRQVRLKRICDASGRPLSDFGEEELQSYVKNGAHFDIVVCKGEKILLALEVDGFAHRYLSRQMEADQKKDGIVKQVFHADIYPNNKKLEQEHEGAFVFLRLPCDGSTCFETDELMEMAEKKQRDHFLTIEDLLRAQLKRRAGEHYVLKEALSDLLKRYQRICWYPSAGLDFRETLFLSQQYFAVNGDLFDETEKLTKTGWPELFVLTDFDRNVWEYVSGRKVYKKGDPRWRSGLENDACLYRDSKTIIRVLQKERLEKLEIPFRKEFVSGGGEDGPEHLGQAVWMELEIRSSYRGDERTWKTELVYVAAENTAFAMDYLLPHEIPVKYLINVRYGSGFGESAMKPEWLLLLLQPLGTEFFISNEIRNLWAMVDVGEFKQLREIYGNRIYLECAEYLPQLRAFYDIDRAECRDGMQNPGGKKWSDYGNVFWYACSGKGEA